MSLGDEIITFDEPQAEETDTFEEFVEEIVNARMERFLDALESNLARAMQKALDTVVSSEEARLRELEEDMAKVMRHLGLDARGPAQPEARDGVEL